MTSQLIQAIVIGVDTHKDTHVAVALDSRGATLGSRSVAATLPGYLELEHWALTFGKVEAFGIEGTGSYGTALSRLLLDHGHRVIEVSRPNRLVRGRHGKNDHLDAEGAARSVLNGQATAVPKPHTGAVEMIRQIKIVRDTAVKSRSQAMVTLKSLMITAPAPLREALGQCRGRMALIRLIAAFRIGKERTLISSTKPAMRSLARRWLFLHDEIAALDRELDTLVAGKAAGLHAAHGIATMTLVDMLILIGDDPTRIKSEAALARLCGVCPIPASSGRTNRFRLNRGGNRQANAALYRVAIVRMRNHPPTLAYVAKRTAEGKTKSEIIRCLKRYIVREIFNALCQPKVAGLAT
ncbi:transposase [Acetobacter nitrogenifigens DSM 23921 = NBRC 105050]|uniref:IS110 family transposase n=2 Tax=Acetobacter nitrogenifigens TaxID=285268 RepID=A0A511XEN9_9PROT|nr:IS110 family transposase [Acetobacter nitrogenifigens]GBQ96570.1 transposase [Acetobacter nitrogenifigens DSM 23921 = NBRC 105050]GEN61420.1 IS110 family transposase [Acetobacter nitrogenifigens DSM 23921 = NBRC 105050]